jgi:hypothetical protein
LIPEMALVAPLCAYAIAVYSGRSPADAELFIAFAVCQIAGIVLYIAEIRYRFKYREGRRR